MKTSPSGWPAIGRTDGNEVPAGYIGEYKTAVLSAISAVGLTNGVPKTVTSLPLPPGDWNVWAAISFSVNATTAISFKIGGLSGTDNTLPAQDDGTRSDSYTSSFVLGAAGDRLPIAARRVNSAVNTTTYAVAAAGFSGGCSSYCRIQARRMS